MAHVSQQKKDTVGEFLQLIDKYDIIGAVNMENLPAKQLQDMRHQLRDTVLVKMTKRRLITVALSNSKKEGIDRLQEHLKGMPALLFTNESPFKLFKTLKKNKSNTAIKGGQTAPSDIVVPAGPTSFAPGPVIGELGSVGIKAGIDAGKVVIKEDCIVAKEGEEVSATLAGLLTRLGIEPMEIGLDLTAVYENGEIITKAVLDIDEDEYVQNLQTASAWAFNLAVNSSYTCKETIEPLLGLAFSQSRNLALDQDILTDVTVGDTLAKAHGHMLGVAGLLPDEALSDDLKGAAQAQASQSTQQAEQSAAEHKADEKKEDDNDKEKPSGDGAAGLGALFG